MIQISATEISTIYQDEAGRTKQIQFRQILIQYTDDGTPATQPAVLQPLIPSIPLTQILQQIND